MQTNKVSEFDSVSFGIFTFGFSCNIMFSEGDFNVEIWGIKRKNYLSE